MRHHRHPRLAALLTTAALALGTVGTTSPASAAPYCGITWGSLPKTTQAWTEGSVEGVRAGRHSCFDRLVIDMTGEAAGFHVQYRKKVRADGSGLVVPVTGGARLQVTVSKPATAKPAMPSVEGFDTFRQVRWAGSFEGYTTFALGVRARLPMRVFTLYDPATDTSRLVVDVAHRW